MKELRSNKMDALIFASVYRNVSKEADAFWSIDTSNISDDSKFKRKVLNIAKTDKRATWKSSIRVAAVACLVVISILFTACMCIPEVREAMLDAFISWCDDHIHIHFAEEIPDESDSREEADTELTVVFPDNIEIKAIATYLPEGYYAVENESLVLYVDTFYYDAEGNMRFRLLQRVIDEASDSDVVIDNEKDPVTTIYINGYEGILVEYSDVPDLYYLVWQDNYYQYSLYGSFASMDELLKIAEGISIE